MLDAKLLRENFDFVQQTINKRKGNYDLSPFKQLDVKRRELIQEIEELKSKQNKVSAKIPKLKKEGQDVSSILEEMKQLSDTIKNLDAPLKELEIEINEFLLSFPNLPHDSVEIGDTDEDNTEIRRVGEVPTFSFEPKPHWEIGESLNILDPTTAGKVTGARFHFYRGLGARLERAIYNFMLDTHTEENGYTEIIPPNMVNKDSMYGTGQLPKFEEDMFKVENTNYYLIPTAEVPVTNIHRGDILDGATLPIKYCALSTNFRAEAGSAGRDTRGLIRQHQFNKVELVQFVKPEESFKALEKLTNDAEKILKLLKIPYRVVNLCTGDLGFSSTKTYDIEVWLPSYNRYVEISSCSNFVDFQARRANIKYKDDVKDKAKLVHTLNGSGLAVGRTVAAILENYQQEDGSVLVPEVLVPYMRINKISK